MSWHCSRALVAEFSEGICSGGAVSVQSNTTPMPEAYYWPDKTTEHSRLSRFGMTSEPLTENRGAELLMSYLADFRARTSVQPAKVRDLTGNEADCGPKWHGSFARYDLASSTWKTAQCSLVEDLEKFSETWPRWGSMRNGVSYLRQIPALPICVSAFGFWPTPTCAMANKEVVSSQGHNNIVAFAKMFPTPTATDGKGAPTLELVKARALESKRGVRLPEQLARDGSVGQLNPNWVEWLMGWPIGWTDLKPLATAKFQEWLQQHGKSFPMTEAA